MSINSLEETLTAIRNTKAEYKQRIIELTEKENEILQIINKEEMEK